MCRPTAAPAQDDTGAVLERLQARLAQQMQLGGPQALNLCGADHLAHVASRGTGPRLFCGHVPPECSEELVKAHFSQWGHVMDVYFPKRKDTFRRRPFCFVTFTRLEDAQRALAESPMNICGIPIKQLNLVEDRSDYYKHRHHAAQSALVQALQTLALLEPAGGAPPLAVPQAPAPAPAVDLSELAALLSLQESAAAAQARPQPYPMHQPMGSPTGMNGYAAPLAAAPRYPATSAGLPFAGLPGFSQAGMPAAPPAYMHGLQAQPAFPPASAAALAAALAGPVGAADWRPAPGASSPFSALDAAGHPSASSSPPNKDLAAAFPLAASHHSTASGSSGSASPDLGAAAANRLAMWQLQSELMAEGAAADWAAPQPKHVALPAAIN